MSRRGRCRATSGNAATPGVRAPRLVAVIALVLLVGSVTASGCAPDPPNSDGVTSTAGEAEAGSTRGPETARVTLGGRTLTVELARSAAEQERGLRGRPGLSDGEGMLFVWDTAAPRAFVQGGVGYPLDVIFVGEDRTVNEVLRLDPSGSTRVQGARPSRWVLEVRAGWAERYGVGPGDELVFE